MFQHPLAQQIGVPATNRGKKHYIPNLQSTVTNQKKLGQINSQTYTWQTWMSTEYCHQPTIEAWEK